MPSHHGRHLGPKLLHPIPPRNTPTHPLLDMPQLSLPNTSYKTSTNPANSFAPIAPQRVWCIRHAESSCSPAVRVFRATVYTCSARNRADGWVVAASATRNLCGSWSRLSSQWIASACERREVKAALMSPLGEKRSPSM
jgi:hypothetical protein